MAPQVGLEPTTLRLTAECSAIELLRNVAAVLPAAMGSGGVLSSRAVSSQVLSALMGLTSVFGMGTGGTPSPLPPEIESNLGLRCYALQTDYLPKVSFVLFKWNVPSPAGPAALSASAAVLSLPVLFHSCGFLSSPLRSSRISTSPRAALSAGLTVYSRPLAHPDNRIGKKFSS